MDNKKPYKEITHEDYVIRIFYPNVYSEELKWHRDRENRKVTVLNDNDWLYQEDNKLPVPLKGVITIPEGLWHRVIKGTTELKVLIEKSSVN